MSGCVLFEKLRRYSYKKVADEYVAPLDKTLLWIIGGVVTALNIALLVSYIEGRGTLLFY